ncbi:MAG: hydrogenase nickel incorporation protein HypA [Euryarchaeota archaeon]|nr:hydrogenase nickel incorporation protein HypA [Euryarchaeota archaeon]
MHEWSLANGIVRTVLQEKEKNGASTIKIVEISVGEISQIDIETLRYALENIARGTPLENSEIRIDMERTELKCRTCGHIWNFEESKKYLEPVGEEGDNALHYLPESVSIFVKCPVCHGQDIEILGGSGVRVKKIIMEVED